MLRLSPSPISPHIPSQKEETLPNKDQEAVLKALVWVWFYVFL